jgi:pentatricopeptide repeat protein
MNSVINSYAQARDRKGAVRWLNKMVDEMFLQPNAITMSLVINAHAQAGDRLDIVCVCLYFLCSIFWPPFRRLFL